MSTTDVSANVHGQNPTCNRYLSDKILDHMDHALGRPADPLMESYRNHFAIDADSALARIFSASPNWRLSGRHQGMAYFSVTKTGRQALAEYLNKLDAPWRRYEVTFDGYSRVVAERSARKAKYSWWLEIHDCLPDMTFFDFCKVARVRVL